LDGANNWSNLAKLGGRTGRAKKAEKGLGIQTEGSEYFKEVLRKKGGGWGLKRLRESAEEGRNAMRELRISALPRSPAEENVIRGGGESSIT